MIYKCIRSTLRTLNLHPIHFFCTKRASNSSKSFLRNDNLIFEDDAHKMIAYFFLPEIKRTQQNTYEINKDSNVLSLIWTGRETGVGTKSEDGNKKSKQYQEKTSFSFKYHELHQLLSVLPKSGLRTTIERKRKMTHQYLTLADNQVKKAVDFTVKSVDPSGTEGATLGKELHFAFAYSKHRIFEILLRKSLFELSGMGLIYQIKREQEVNSPLNNTSKLNEQIQKEIQEFYK